MSTSRVVQLTQDLIRFNSVSCHSNTAISDYVAELLVQAGFVTERVEYNDARGVRKVNLIAKRGEGTGGIMFSGHTDVVPVDDWLPTPAMAFTPTIIDQRLYGRGACDMKGSLAAALTAAENMDPQRQRYPLYFCVSADEELSMVGARYIARESKLFREMVSSQTVAIVGEPTELQVYYAHKGTLLLTLRSHGVSAHTSSRAGVNANQSLFAALPELEQLRLTTESDSRWMNPMFDPPTLSWNWIIRNEPFATNITPSLAELQIFLRPMPAVDHHVLVREVRKVADKYGLEFLQSEEAPSLHGAVDSILVRSMLDVTGQDTAKTACYATDGAVLQELKQIVVCGPGSIAQAHRNDEWIALDQLDKGVLVFQRAFEKFCFGHG